MPHALLTLFISVQCMAMFFFSSFPFCHRHAVALCSSLFPFHGYAWCMPLPHATRYRNILEHSSVDLVQTCTYICSSIKGCKCQPENSSLVLLVFPHYSQRDHLQNWLLALSVYPPFLQFPRVPVDAVTFWVVSVSHSSSYSLRQHLLMKKKMLLWSVGMRKGAPVPTWLKFSRWRKWPLGPLHT